MRSMWAARILFFISVAVATFLLMELMVGHWEW